MTSFIASLALLTLTVASLLIALNVRRIGGRLFLFGIALSVVAPIFDICGTNIGASFAGCPMIAVVITVIVIALVAAAFIRYKVRRRRFDHLTDRPRTSRKWRKEQL